jgi:hypothetical protein
VDLPDFPELCPFPIIMFSLAMPLLPPVNPSLAIKPKPLPPKEPDCVDFIPIIPPIDPLAPLLPMPTLLPMMDLLVATTAWLMKTLLLEMDRVLENPADPRVALLVGAPLILALLEAKLVDVLVESGVLDKDWVINQMESVVLRTKRVNKK